jgi:hypothetical protein
MDYKAIDNNKMVEDFRILITIPYVKVSMYHRIEELKGVNAKEYKQYRELEKMVDPGSPEKETGKKETKEESYKQQVNFEIEKVKRRWTVYPAIPKKILNHIISHSNDLKPGIIKMQKFKLPGGKMIDLSFELQQNGCITGSIVEKSFRKAKKESPSNSIQAGGTGSKTEVLKTVIAYLKYNETFSDWLINEFFERWKPVIDKGFIISER